jgi:protein arginine N-methyltransferase 1
MKGLYSIADYGQMTADRIRTLAYWEALRASVNPDLVVLEIGTGFGSLALLACRAGANRVYAVEPNDVIQLAHEIAVQNGYENRIHFIQAESTRISLPEKVDLIVSDLRGVLPLFRNHIPTIIDARKRMLSPDGILIPKQDTLWAAVVEAPTIYRLYDEPWHQNHLGLNLKHGEEFAKNSWRKDRVSPDALLADPICWATLDYQTIQSPDVSFDGDLVVKRSGTGHGLNIWFDTTLIEGVTFSNGPKAPELVYRSIFLPWLHSVPLNKGDVVRLHLSADLVSEDYVWCWNTQVFAGANAGEPKANFRQSTFFSIPLSLSKLLKQELSYKPSLNEDGDVTSFILQLMDGESSVEKLAKRLVERFPSKYANCNEALKDINEVSQKYSG